MIDEKKYTAENLRPRFGEYLEKTHTADIDGLLECAEDELPQILREYSGMPCTTVYELSDRHVLHNLRSRMQTDPVLRQRNEASGNRLSQTAKKYAEFLQSKYFQEKFPAKKKTKHEPTPPPSPPEPQPRELTEGAKSHIETEQKKRNPQLRKACLDHYGYQCQCCGMDFEKLYGDAGRRFIEVHHLKPISTYEDEHTVNPLTDLVPLCSNCHSMIHRGQDGVMTLQELRETYQGPTWEIKKRLED